MHQDKTQQGFRSLPLTPSLLSKLERLGFITPTPIQREAIPPAMEGRDIVGLAKTGSGKTLAFALPIAVRLRPMETALVLAPTRELAIQIQEVFGMLGISAALLIGGAPMRPQVQQLKSDPKVLVATPGRLQDHIDQRTVDLRRTKIVVLDEADRMLDMGFAPAVRKIFGRLPERRQTLLFSATMPREIEDLAAQFLSNPVSVEVDRSGETVGDVEQQLVLVPQEHKPEILEQLLSEHRGSVLVFARTRHGARRLARGVSRMGHASAEIHSDRTLPQRQAALQGFKKGTFRVLVATDIAARGIDVKDISLVINYDIPQSAEDYIHRIGRTGRAGASGLAITLATPEQHKDVRNIERLLRTEIPLAKNSMKRVDRRAKVISAPAWPAKSTARESRPNRLFAPSSSAR